MSEQDGAANDDVVKERSRQLREDQYVAFLESSARERSGDDSSDEEAGNEEEQDGQEVDQPYEQLGDGNEEDEEFGEFAGPLTTPITHQMDDATLFQTVLDNLDRREKVGASMSDDDALFASSKPSAPVQAEPSRVTALGPLDPEKRALIMSAMQNFKPKGGARPALDVIADSIVRAHQHQGN